MPTLIAALEHIGRTLLYIVSVMIFIAGIVWGIIYLRDYLRE